MQRMAAVPYGAAGDAIIYPSMREEGYCCLHAESEWSVCATAFKFFEKKKNKEKTEDELNIYPQKADKMGSVTIKLKIKQGP